MLHLAQVVKNSVSKQLELHLLAAEKSGNKWDFCNEKYIYLPPENNLSEHLLLLVELTNNDEIIRYRHAKDWVLNLVRKSLASQNLSDDFLLEEKARIEKWRQELTSQSQDLTRVRLEIETRREELQELEKKLSMERDKSSKS